MAGLSLPVYLVHWDAPEWCASSASSILASDGVEVDLVVVDNGQQHGPPLRGLLPAHVRVITMAENRGYTAGVNTALADWCARDHDGELCVVGSHDLHVEPGTLAALAELVRSSADCGIVAPALVAPNPVSGGSWNGVRSRQHPLEGAPAVVERQWASGTCLMLRRSCVEEVGRFDERFGSYVEDVDYGLRAGDRGWRVLVLTSARARGLGGVAEDVLASITCNTVLLNAKRRGLRGTVASLALVGAYMTKGYVGSVAPWRDGTRRRASRHHAEQRRLGIRRLVTGGQLSSVLRDPDGDYRWPTAPASPS